MFCRNCGAAISLGGKFCAKCGQRQSEIVAPSVTRVLATRSADRSLDSRTNIAGADLKIKTLFVIGAQSSRESEAWLKARFPNSQVIKFSTIGAVRETVLR